MFNKIFKIKKRGRKNLKLFKYFNRIKLFDYLFNKKRGGGFISFLVQIFSIVSVRLVLFVKLLMVVMIRTVEMRYFRPIAVIIFLIFLLINVGLYVRVLMINAESNFDEQRQNEIIEIRILDEGKIVDVDEVQIFERVVERGDTVLGFLFDIGVEENEIIEILSAMKKKINPRDIVIGNSLIAKYKVKFQHDDRGSIDEKLVLIDEFKIVASPELEYKVTKSNSLGKYEAKKIVHKFEKKLAKFKGVIDNGLFVDATKAGASANAVMNMIALYGYDVDFQRDIRSGDEFEIVVESYYNKGGKRIKDGNVLFARLDLANKKDIAMYAHRMRNGSLQYFDKKGYSVKKSLLKTPINGARVSSRFGMRKHPVLGYSKLHKGVDFAARTGTPIFAAGDGVIARRLWNGGYGRYIKIKHNSTYSTAYAHMSRFNRRFKRGSRVKQGDVIGYVGTTGRSTGPHLHFEVIKKGRAINPARVKAVSGTRLKGRVLKEFKRTVEKIEKYRKKSKG